MKTKLYHKFVKLVCSDFKITRKQLFSRQFNLRVIVPYKYDLSTHKLVDDESRLMVLNTQRPLSRIYECYDLHTRWLVKYWKHSHWKSFIQAHLDIGMSLDDTVKKILQKS